MARQAQPFRNRFDRALIRRAGMRRQTSGTARFSPTVSTTCRDRTLTDGKTTAAVFARAFPDGAVLGDAATELAACGSGGRSAASSAVKRNRRRCEMDYFAGLDVSMDDTAICVVTDGGEVAERVGFEPTEDLHPQRFSRPPHSTTLPPLRVRGRRRMGM
jgi:hypothetical protein